MSKEFEELTKRYKVCNLGDTLDWDNFDDFDLVFFDNTGNSVYKRDFAILKEPDDISDHELVLLIRAYGCSSDVK